MLMVITYHYVHAYGDYPLLTNVNPLLINVNPLLTTINHHKDHKHQLPRWTAGPQLFAPAPQSYCCLLRWENSRHVPSKAGSCRTNGTDQWWLIKANDGDIWPHMATYGDLYIALYIYIYMYS